MKSKKYTRNSIMCSSLLQNHENTKRKTMSNIKPDNIVIDNFSIKNNLINDLSQINKNIIKLKCRKDNLITK